MADKDKKELKINDAIKRPGALSKKAEAADMTVNQYAEKHKNDNSLTGDQARFYLNVLKKANKNRKK